MIKKLFIRFTRAPVPAVAILLFAAIISVIICTLHASNEAELRNYEEAWKSVPITMTVTELSGTNSEKFLMESWVLDLFTGEEPIEYYKIEPGESLGSNHNGPGEKLSLAEYVKNVNVKLQRVIHKINNRIFRNSAKLIGIASLLSDKQLLPEYGCEITWYEGYDESIFEGEEAVCLVPKSMAEKYDNGDGEVVLDFQNTGSLVITMVDGKPKIESKAHEYQCTLKIVGTYTAGDEQSIYCPASIVKRVVVEGLEEELFIYSLSATLADNTRLDEFREKMSICFLEPSLNAEKVPCGLDLILSNTEKVTRAKRLDFYPYAIDINDDNLFDLAAILEDSIEFNRKVTLIVVALSVVSGFLVGFLMIRRRKKDILLMRTVGESNFRLYIGFILEQMICIILGIALGGSYYNWNPIKNLAIFAVVYFVGLSLALAIFMSKKLLTSVKEDE